MRSVRSAFVIAALLALAPALRGQASRTAVLNRQESERLELGRLQANKQKLSFKLTADTPDILPGEDFCVTFSITNPTSTPLEVFDPFRSANTGFNVSVWSGLSWRPTSGEPFGSDQDAPGDPKIVIRAHEAIGRRYCAFDEDDDDGVPNFTIGYPGKYRLSSGYSGSAIEFDVPEVSFVAMVQAKLPRVLKLMRCRCANDGRSFPFEGELRGAIVQVGADQFLVMSRFTLTGPFRVPEPGSKEDFAASLGVKPFVRIAKSSTAIVDVSISADSEDSAQLAWASGSRSFRTTLGRARRPGPIHSEARVGHERD